MSPIFTYAAELYREMREEFELSVEAAHAAAEEGTHGSMLNKHGRAEGIDAYSLMTGPWSRVERYGSPELIEWCESNGRPSVARFEREWFASWQGETPLPDAELVMPDYDVNSPEYIAAARRFNEAHRCQDPKNHSQPCNCGAAVTWMGPDLPQTSLQHKADC